VSASRSFEDVFDDLGRRYSHWDPARNSAQAPPTRAELERLEREQGHAYPPSFVAFQLEHSVSTPMGDNAGIDFGWAHRTQPNAIRGLGVALEEIVADARMVGVDSTLLPFRADADGNFFCFDTQCRRSDGECPVVFWDHDVAAVLDVSHYRWSDFATWLAAGLDHPDSEANYQ
jgi:hypothetical protein